MSLFTPIPATEHIKMLQSLYWYNNTCKAKFTAIRTKREQYPEYQWFIEDLISWQRRHWHYYETPKGLYIEMGIKEYYRVIEFAYMPDVKGVVFMNMQNIADTTDYYQFLGYPDPR